MMSVLTPIEEAIEAYRNGEFLIVMDDEDRENEGDLIIAAEHVTQLKMAFLIRYSSGYICAPLSTAKADALELPLMIANNTDRHGTAYTITVDVNEGTTTGISAHDRALTVNALSKADAKPTDFLRPGHIVPLRARPGLLHERDGHTEAGVHLCKLAGLQEAAVIGELVNDDDGSMKRFDDCVKFSKEHGVKLVTIKQIKEYITKNDK